jgi:hypothetical protein
LRTLVLQAKRINIFSITIRLVLLVLCACFVISAIVQSENKVAFSSLTNIFSSAVNILTLCFILALAFVNWGLEAYKWKRMTFVVQEISFKQAFHSVFTGVAAGFATPNRIGDYYGRTLQFKKEHALKVAAINLVSGFAQFIATAGFGVCGILYLMLNTNHSESTFSLALPYLFVCGTVFLILHVLLFFHPEWLIKPFSKSRWIGKYVRMATAFEYYSFRELIQFILLSVFRTLVFTLQMYLLMKIVGIDLSFGFSFMLISAYFFLLTISPSLMMNKLGLRESLAVLVFGVFVSSVWTIVSAVFLLWLLNQVVPACCGAWLMIKYKPE